MSPTMSLVIGIIIGSFTAMILIVIIVLKVRTGVDLSEIKQVGVKYKIRPPFHWYDFDVIRRKCKDTNFLLHLVEERSTSIVIQPPPVLLTTENQTSTAMVFSTGVWVERSLVKTEPDCSKSLQQAAVVLCVSGTSDSDRQQRHLASPIKSFISVTS